MAKKTTTRRRSKKATARAGVGQKYLADGDESMEPKRDDVLDVLWNEYVTAKEKAAKLNTLRLEKSEAMHERLKELQLTEPYYVYHRKDRFQLLLDGEPRLSITKVKEPADGEASG